VIGEGITFIALEEVYILLVALVKALLDVLNIWILLTYWALAQIHQIFGVVLEADDMVHVLMKAGQLDDLFISDELVRTDRAGRRIQLSFNFLHELFENFLALVLLDRIHQLVQASSRFGFFCAVEVYLLLVRLNKLRLLLVLGLQRCDLLDFLPERITQLADLVLLEVVNVFKPVHLI